MSVNIGPSNCSVSEYTKPSTELILIYHQYATKNVVHFLFKYYGVNKSNPDSKVHGANMGPIWGRQDPGGPHVGPMNFAIWEAF